MLAAVADHKPSSLFAAIVFATFAVYMVNFRELGLADTVPATLLAASLVREGNFDLDEFEPMLEAEHPGGGLTSVRRQLEWTMAVRLLDGHLRSSYPVGAALLAVPVYAARLAVGNIETFTEYRATGKAAAALLVALSAGFMFLALSRLCSRRGALVLTAFYAFGTAAWTIASQALWQHGPAMMCLAAALWLTLRLEERPTASDMALGSLAASMVVICRPQDIVAAAPLGMAMLVRAPRYWWALLLPAVCLGAFQVAYNVHVFHRVAGGYSDLYMSEAHRWRGLNPTSAMTLPLLEGLSGLLLSPGKGLLVYTPLAALAFAAMPFAVIQRPTATTWALIAWVLLTLLLYGKNRLWWGGTAYGPRYLTELMIPVTAFLGMVWGPLTRRRILFFALIAAGTFGVLVQIIGACTWECGWHHFPAWIDFAPERIWDPRDPEILRCARVLAESGPKPAEFGPWAPP